MSKIPAWIHAARAKWKYRGQARPSFAEPPGEGQESVWDYPRPPRLVSDSREVLVRVGSTVIAQSHRAIRVLETASPPTFYLPPDDVRTDLLRGAEGDSFCEWKGQARYWSVTLENHVIKHAAWSYDEPLAGFETIAGYLSFYPGKLECYVAGVRVEPQPGGLYGGWITPDVVGPFKGEPGTKGW